MTQAQQAVLCAQKTRVHKVQSACLASCHFYSKQGYSNRCQHKIMKTSKMYYQDNHNSKH